MEKMQLDADVAKLKLQKASHLSQRYMLEDRIIKDFPRQIKEKEERLAGYDADIVTAEQNTHKDEKGFSPMVLSGEIYAVKADAGKKILDICKSRSTPEPKPIGEYRGFRMELGFDVAGHEFFIDLKGTLTHPVSLGQDANGIITRLDNVIDSLPTRRQNCADQLAEIHRQLENAKEEVAKPFSREEELSAKSKRLDELNAELNMDRRENEIADEENEQEEDGAETEQETGKGTEYKKPKCR